MSLVKSGFKKPCIIIACYPSCRIGEVAKIIDLFSREEERNKNTVGWGINSRTLNGRKYRIQ